MNGKRSICAFLVLFALLLLTAGCENNSSESTTYTIYYKNTSGTSLYEVSYKPSAETFDEMMTELMAQMATVPADAVYVSTLPETVVYQGYERGIDALRIDFSSEYYEMDNITEVLLRAAVVKTICQIPGVTKIIITVNSEQLVDANGDLVAAMDAESFIDTKNGGINSYQTASLVLYFPNQDGTMLLKEVRNVDYSSNMVLERVIVEQLIAGSEYSDRMALLNSSTEILDVTTKNGICTINFSEEFNQAPTDGAASAEVALYAIVNSICETSDTINGVKFTVEGSSNVTFWDEIDLNNVFIMKESLIETETLESDTEISAAEAEGESAVDNGDADDEAETVIDGDVSDGTDGTVSDNVGADAAAADTAGADGAAADDTDANGTAADAVGADGTAVSGTGANGTAADGTVADGTGAADAAGDGTIAGVSGENAGEQAQTDVSAGNDVLAGVE
ncbi:MAG: GerMN domain-containing protein [Lachnospiraceae bacterium]|nr:GerMN domain-containing protein [Lachnospiraceae bacterium]